MFLNFMQISFLQEFFSDLLIFHNNHGPSCARIKQTGLLDDLFELFFFKRWHWTMSGIGLATSSVGLDIIIVEMAQYLPGKPGHRVSTSSPTLYFSYV